MKKVISTTFHFYMKPEFIKQYNKLMTKTNSSYYVRALINQFRENNEHYEPIKDKFSAFCLKPEELNFIKQHNEFGFPSASSFLQYIITIGNIDIIEPLNKIDGDYGYYGDVEYASAEDRYD